MRPDPENIEVMVNMPKPSRGLFQYNRLPFGVSSSPAIFQRVIDNVLQIIPYVCAYLDDILVTGRTDEEHLKRLVENVPKSHFRSTEVMHASMYMYESQVQWCIIYQDKCP